MLKIYTDYVPARTTYITAGKRYEITPDGLPEHGLLGGWITDEDGDNIYVCINECSHLDHKPWQVDNG